MGCWWCVRNVSFSLIVFFVCGDFWLLLSGWWEWNVFDGIVIFGLKLGVLFGLLWMNFDLVIVWIVFVFFLVWWLFKLICGVIFILSLLGLLLVVMLILMLLLGELLCWKCLVFLELSLFVVFVFVLVLLLFGVLFFNFMLMLVVMLGLFVRVCCLFVFFDLGLLVVLFLFGFWGWLLLLSMMGGSEMMEGLVSCDVMILIEVCKIFLVELVIWEVFRLVVLIFFVGVLLVVFVGLVIDLILRLFVMVVVGVVWWCGFFVFLLGVVSFLSFFFDLFCDVVWFLIDVEFLLVEVNLLWLVWFFVLVFVVEWVDWVVFVFVVVMDLVIVEFLVERFDVLFLGSVIFVLEVSFLIELLLLLVCCWWCLCFFLFLFLLGLLFLGVEVLRIVLFDLVWVRGFVLIFGEVLVKLVGFKSFVCEGFFWICCCLLVFEWVNDLVLRLECVLIVFVLFFVCGVVGSLVVMVVVIEFWSDFCLVCLFWVLFIFWVGLFCFLFVVWLFKLLWMIFGGFILIVVVLWRVDILLSVEGDWEVIGVVFVWVEKLVVFVEVGILMLDVIWVFIFELGVNLLVSDCWICDGWLGWKEEFVLCVVVCFWWVEFDGVRVGCLFVVIFWLRLCDLFMFVVLFVVWLMVNCCGVFMVSLLFCVEGVFVGFLVVVGVCVILVVLSVCLGSWFCWLVLIEGWVELGELLGEIWGICVVRLVVVFGSVFFLWVVVGLLVGWCVRLVEVGLVINLVVWIDVWVDLILMVCVWFVGVSLGWSWLCGVGCVEWVRLLFLMDCGWWVVCLFWELECLMVIEWDLFGLEEFFVIFVGLEWVCDIFVWCFWDVVVEDEVEVEVELVVMFVEVEGVEVSLLWLVEWFVLLVCVDGWVDFLWVCLVCVKWGCGLVWDWGCFIFVVFVGLGIEVCCWGCGLVFVMWVVVCLGCVFWVDWVGVVFMVVWVLIFVCVFGCGVMWCFFVGCFMGSVVVVVLVCLCIWGCVINWDFCGVFVFWWFVEVLFCCCVILVCCGDFVVEVLEFCCLVICLVCVELEMFFVCLLWFSLDCCWLKWGVVWDGELCWMCCGWICLWGFLIGVGWGCLGVGLMCFGLILGIFGVIFGVFVILICF